MQRGYVKLFRKTADNGLMKNAQLLQFWVWCLLRASRKKHACLVGKQKVDLEPGQFIFGRQVAAEALNSTEKKIRTCVDVLVAMQNMAIKRTNKFSIVTICNWSTYQDEEEGEGPAKGPTSDNASADNGKGPATNPVAVGLQGDQGPANKSEEDRASKRANKGPATNPVAVGLQGDQGPAKGPTKGHKQEERIKDLKEKKEHHCPDNSGPVAEIFDYWKIKTNHPRSKIDTKRKKAISGRLKDGYTVQDICRAIDGCLLSPHHQGQNETRTVYDDIELICRDNTKIDRFIAYAEGRGQAKKIIQPDKKLTGSETVALLRAMREAKNGTAQIADGSGSVIDAEFTLSGENSGGGPGTGERLP